MLRLLAFAAALCLSGPPMALGQSSDRLTLRQDRLGWEAVGRLDLGRQGYCTGTLIAPGLVLTAAHCVYDRRGRLQAPGEILFRAGYADGASVAESAAVRILAHPAFDPADGLSFDSIRHDVALIELAQPIPSATAAPFPVADPSTGRTVSLMSYGTGRDEALTWQRSCAVIGRRDGLLAFDCDAVSGSSGAPVFDRSGARARIVSIVSAAGEGTIEGVPVTFGMELPRLVEELKAVLAASAGPGISAERRLRPGTGVRDSGAKFLRP